MNGMTESLHPKHRKKERIPCLLSQSCFQKEKLSQLSVPPLLVKINSKTLHTYGFLLSEREAKKPNVILKHLQEHFMASEGVLTERTKFAQMKQEDQESLTAWEGRVKRHIRDQERRTDVKTTR